MAQRYDTYKDSGVQWLGMIPGHWGCVALKRLINIYNGCDYKNVECTDGVPVFGSGGPFTYAREVMYNGEVVMYGRKGTIDKPLYYMGPFWTIDTMFYSVVKSNKLLAKFQYYVSTQMPLKKLSTSTALPSMTMTTLGGIGIPLPPLPEQRAIVDYLDDKCGKVDEWIEKKQKEVELLGEMKQRVIADAVTRGLNPNVKMKPTNIPWLPEVPEHWEVRRNKWIFKEEDEKNDDLSYQLLSFSRHKGIIPFAENTDKAPSASDLTKYKIIHKGQLLENRMQAWSGMFGCSYIEGCVSPDYSVFSPINGANTEYYAYLYRTPLYVQQFANASKGIGDGFNRLYTPQFYKIYAICPPLSEQREIVAYIADKTAKIDKMVENVNKEIEALKEYKQRLISDVVTGQIKVC